MFAFCLLFFAIFGSVRGIVHDPQHRPLAGAQVTLAAAHSQWRASAQSNALGEFEFQRVPTGDYVLTVRQPGFRAVRETLTVGSGEAPILHVELPLASVNQSTTVTAAAPVGDVESATPTSTVNRTAIARTPGADQSNSLAMITDYVPGAYMVHDQLHVRGGHQVSWLVDGVPVPNTNIASNVGPQFDPNDVDTLEAQRGSYEAGYGDRTYGVFNVLPRTGFESNRAGELVASAGNFQQTNDQLNFGSHTDRFAYYASVNGNRSTLGLETPTPVVAHDAENGFGGFQSLIFNATPRDQLRAVASERRDFYQIPGTAQDAQREVDAFVNTSWVRTLNASTLLTVSPFYHFNRADYDGATTTDNRASSYVGAQATLAATQGPSNLELGFYGFAQHDDQLFALRGILHQPEAASGQLEEEFGEEKYSPTAWWTLMAGLRQSHFGGGAGGVHENATAPRLGTSVRLPRFFGWPGWVLRGNYARYYQAPPLLTASGPLLQFINGQNLGFIPLRGERDEEWQAGVTIPLGQWALDGDYFHNRARNFFDHNNVGNSDIFFPLTIAGARIQGYEATLRSPRLWRRGQVHVAYANQMAQGEGAVTGGLTDFAPPANSLFWLDHDQRTTVSAGGEFNLPRQAYIAANLYFGSGFANGEAPPSHLPAHASLDLTLGKQLRENLSASATVLNLTNTHLLTDNSLTFGGTHFNNPREFSVELRYRFHY